MRLADMFLAGSCFVFMQILVSSTLVVNRKDSEKYKPRNVAVEIVNKTSVHLKWEHPKDTDLNRCPVRRYTIRLKTEGAKRSRTWKIDGVRQSVALHDLSAGTTYYVRLLAIACDGKGKPSRWVRVQTSTSSSSSSSSGKVVDESDSDDSSHESQSPGKPTYVRTRTFPDSVIVSWLPPEDSTVIRGYMVGYGEGVPDVNWQYVDAKRQNVTLKNLKPATQYIVSIRAFNNFGKGPVVYDLIYTRELTATTSGPASAPTDLRAKILSPTTAWLQWTDPSLGRQQLLTDTRYYNVHYQPKSPAGGKTLSVIVKALHVVLYDLMPGTMYEFKVRMVKDSQATPFSESVHNSTLETAPSSPPRGIVIIQGNYSGSVLVSWRPPRFPNGEITGYLVLYSQDSNLPTEKWQVQATAGQTTETIVANLTPNKTYHFKIQARNSNGYSPVSSSSIFYSSFLPGTSNNPLTKLTNVVREMTEDYGKELLNKTMNDTNTTGNSTTEPDIPTVEVNNNSTTPTVTTFASDIDIADDNTKGDEYDYEELEEEEVLNGAQSAALVSENSTSLFMPAGDVIRKRGQNFNEGPSAAGREEREENIEVLFRAMVRHHVSAYVTWPAMIGQKCSRDSSAVVGYTFRYRLEQIQGEEEQLYVTLNTTNNFIVLDDLLPNVRFRYQVKYLLGNSRETPWSRVDYIDTHPGRQ